MKSGRWTIFASKSSDGSILADSADMLTLLRSSDALVPIPAPSRSLASASCWLVIPAAPSSSMARVTLCNPRWFGASDEAPASNDKAIWVVGTAPRCA